MHVEQVVEPLLEPCTPFKRWNPCWNPRWNPLPVLDPPLLALEPPFKQSVGRGSIAGFGTFEPILNQPSGQQYTLFLAPTNTRNNISLNSVDIAW